MRELTFKGYLEKYVRRLSMSNTNSIYRLTNEVKDNHRLRYPLLLYALCAGKVDLLLKSTKDDALLRKYTEIAERYTWHTMLKALELGDDSLDKNYLKAYNSYLRKRDMQKTNTESKMLMHEKIKRLQDAAKVSNYRIYTDLRLNAGNVNAYIKNGDTSKVSLDTARRIVAYLEHIPT